MVGTKIFVLQMKDLIRTAVFAVLGLILVILLVVLFIPRGNAQTPNPNDAASLYIPGTYTSSIVLNGQPVEVYVTVSENEITAVEMSAMDEVQQVFYPLFKPAMDGLAADVLRLQSMDVVSDSDYPVTSGILQQALTNALAQAALTETAAQP